MLKNPNSLSFIKPHKYSLYYGYVIALVGTLGVLASLPGQTMGVSTFTDPVKDALGLNRDQISFAYMIGTFISSLFLGKAGKWFDKYGARWLAFFATVGLSTSLFVCSQADVISDFVQDVFGVNHYLIPAGVMVVLFFMIRFSGQGVLTLASRNMIMKWFDVLRGRVNAFSAIVVSLGFSASPLWISKLIDLYGWKRAWIIMGVGILMFSIVIIQFFRDNPEKHGLLPDGKVLDKDDLKDESQVKKQYTLTEAKKTKAFWMYSLTLAFYSFFVTGLTFHIISIFGSVSYSPDEAVAVFVPISVVAVTISLIANFISDWIKLQALLYLNIFGGILAALGLVFLSYPWGVYMLVAGSGIMGGLFSVLVAVSWPRFFGRKNLGAISGKSMSMIVMASAIGPIVFSRSDTMLGTYAGVGYISIAFLLVIAILSIKAYNPQ